MILPTRVADRPAANTFDGEQAPGALLCTCPAIIELDAGAGSFNIEQTTIHK